MFLTLLFLNLLYVSLAIGLVWIVWKKTKRKLYKYLMIAFFVLLPTWDVLLGFIVYRVAIIAGIPSAGIYETARTEGIYYEGMNNVLSSFEDKSSFIGGFQHSFKNCFKYAEAKVTEQYSGHGRYMKMKPVLYRCEALPTKEQNPDYFPMNCYRIEKPISQYAVIASVDLKVGIAEINTKKIINRSSGKLMAQYRQVVSHGYLGMFLWNNGPIPFFNWLDWWINTAPSLCKPDCGHYYSFEYKVLTPK